MKSRYFVFALTLAGVLALLSQGVHRAGSPEPALPPFVPTPISAPVAASAPAKPRLEPKCSGIGRREVWEVDYCSLPGWPQIQMALQQPRCYKALGAASADEALRIAARTPIHFGDLNPKSKREWWVIAWTDGYRIYWDITRGNPIPDPRMPHDMEASWVHWFHLRVPLSSSLFSAVMFLHELGHICGGLPDDNANHRRNLANTQKVIDSCFRAATQELPPVVESGGK